MVPKKNSVKEKNTSSLPVSAVRALGYNLWGAWGWAMVYGVHRVKLCMILYLVAAGCLVAVVALGWKDSWGVHSLQSFTNIRERL